MPLDADIDEECVNCRSNYVIERVRVEGPNLKIRVFQCGDCDHVAYTYQYIGAREIYIVDGK